MADVFLSYARANAREARRIAGELRSNGFSVWLDEKLPAHRAYSDVIEEQLEAAKAVLVLWSSESVRSQWVRSEANRARETGRLVQVRLDDARLPMPFDQIQCADLRHWKGDPDTPQWETVLSSIAALAGSDERPAVVDRRTAPASPPKVSRRAAVLGGGALTVAAIGGFTAWRALERSEVSPEAELLLQKGNDALQNNDVFAADNPGSLANAIALLSHATQLDPHNATAWGSLALAYAGLKRVSPVPRRPGLDSRSRSAAATAFKFRPHEPRATAALLLLEPVYRNWRGAERAARAALKNAAPIPLLFFLLSETLASVGRWKEAAAMSIKADRKRFLIPGADRRVVIDLWAAGDLAGADEALKLAVEHWPQQPQVWRTRLAYLMYSGRPLDALAILHNEAERPPDTPPGLVQAFDASAKALAGTGNPADAVARSLNYLETDPAALFGVVHACVSLGQASTALPVLRGYYFAEGEWAKLSPPAGDQDRKTSPLFMPPMRPVWKDAQFADLLTRIGLEDYWRESRTLPDFRRGA